MKKIILGVSLLISSIICNAQVTKEISLDNSLTGMSSQSKDGNQVNINFTGNNSFDYGKNLALDLGTNYQVGYSPELSQNEFIQKANLAYNKEHWDLFTTYQFNYSLLREINSDNWFGVGGGVKEQYKWGKASLSYAFIYQNTDFMNLDNKVTLRHSIRGKIKFEKKLFSIKFGKPVFNLSRIKTAC